MFIVEIGHLQAIGLSLNEQSPLLKLHIATYLMDTGSQLILIYHLTIIVLEMLRLIQPIWFI